MNIWQYSPRAENDSKKNGAIFFYGEIYISLNISIDGLQPTCRYQLRVNRGPHDFSLGLALVELVLNTW